MSERELFVAALQLTDPVAGAAFLDQAYGAARPLRDCIASLLIEHDKMGNFLEAPATASADAGTRAFIFFSTYNFVSSGSSQSNNLPATRNVLRSSGG
jgi:hypothetical protein